MRDKTLADRTIRFSHYASIRRPDWTTTRRLYISTSGRYIMNGSEFRTLREAHNAFNSSEAELTRLGYIGSTTKHKAVKRAIAHAA